MEVFARLEHIAYLISQLKQKNTALQNQNAELDAENQRLQNQLNKTTEELHSLEETNKIAKLAQSTLSSSDNSAFKKEIDHLIKEIDKCLKLIKQE
ncbi:MAG: hypothetical protein HOI49_04315 [Bacteroidetes bacterium]|jgi:cell division protein FtsB|nr:hypothetical protein [Bacteroidota bacterium]